MPSGPSRVICSRTGSDPSGPEPTSTACSASGAFTGTGGYSTIGIDVGGVIQNAGAGAIGLPLLPESSPAQDNPLEVAAPAPGAGPTRFLVAQGDSPERTAVWTVVSAPTGADLRAGMDTLAQETGWQQLDGYVTLERKGTETLDTRAVSSTRFVATQPWTFANLRLIAANWLSSNILAYAVVFCVLSILLGIATSGLLRRFGRSN